MYKKFRKIIYNSKQGLKLRRIIDKSIIISKLLITRIAMTIFKNLLNPIHFEQFSNFVDNKDTQTYDYHIEYWINLSDDIVKVSENKLVYYERSVITLKNIIVFGESGYINFNNKLMVDQNHYHRAKLKKYNIRDVVFDRKYPIFKYSKQHILDDALILNDEGFDNYGHWFFELIATLSEIDTFKINTTNIVLPKPKKEFQISTVNQLLKRFNVYYYSRSNILIKNGYFVQKKSVPETGPLSYTKYSNFLRNLFEINILNSEPYRKIFISRENTFHGRKIINKKELYSFLKTNGFEIIKNENLSLNEQLRVFSESKIIIGPHGAGLTNIFASKKGTFLIEIQHFSRIANTFKNLSFALGLNYNLLLDNTVTTDEDPNIFVDIKLLDSILSKCK